MTHLVISRPSSPAWTRALLSVGIGLALLVLSANYKIPLEPVPLSLQFFAVLMIGFTMPLRTALTTAVLYAVGSSVFGVPIAAGNPFFTGGYLLGFVATAALISAVWPLLSSKSFVPRTAGAIGIALLGAVIMHVLGLVWLHYAMLNGHADQTWMASFANGTLPFVWLDLTKVLVAALVTSIARSFR